MTTAHPSIYPIDRAERDRWILESRPQRNPVDPCRPSGFFVEEERSSAGEIVPVATILLTNRECPWRCLMCDLWKNTLTETAPAGAIPEQIIYALERLATSREIKLYNSGSFFDPRAIPPQEYLTIANLVRDFDRVIVESHPALIGKGCFEFQELLCGRLEVAMGLETVHPEVLARLNKQMTLDQFSAAAEKLCEQQIDLRVFILVKPPFMEEKDALEWAKRSLDFAFDCGASAASLIPVRAGNGALDRLAASREFAAPGIATLEAAAEYGISLGRGRVFADLWNVNAGSCPVCNELRVNRLRWMNLHQVIPAAIRCLECGAALDR